VGIYLIRSAARFDIDRNEQSVVELKRTNIAGTRPFVAELILSGQNSSLPAFIA
jgi:hypothetical protein